MTPEQIVRQGDILHVPFGDGCAEYLVIKQDLIVMVQKSPEGGGGDAYQIDTTEAMTHHWSGVHLNTVCRDPDSDYDEQELVWRDA